MESPGTSHAKLTSSFMKAFFTDVGDWGSNIDLMFLSFRKTFGKISPDITVDNMAKYT